MTTYLPPVSLTPDRTATIPAEARRAHPARWLQRRRDGKVALLAGVDSLAECRDRDLVALAAAADMVDVPSGTVLGEGSQLAHYWWMPIDGWLLVSGHGNQAITVPSGWSWASPGREVPAELKISALRGGRILTTTVPRLLGTLEDFPRLSTAIRSTLVLPAANV